MKYTIILLIRVYGILLFSIISCNTKSVKTDSFEKAIAFDTASRLNNLWNDFTRKYGENKAEQAELLLEPIERELINQIYFNQQFSKLEMFDGNHKIVRTLQPDEMVYLSQNQKYFIIEKNAHMDSTDKISIKKYNIELFDNANHRIGLAQLDYLDSDEEEDKLIPFNDGSGILQKAFRFGSSFAYKIYRVTGKGQWKQTGSFLNEHAYGSLTGLSTDSGFFFLLYYETNENTDTSNILTIEKWTVNGSLLWRKKLNNKIVSQDPFISESGDLIGFAYAATKSAYANQFCILDQNGQILMDKNWDSIGYDACSFKKIRNDWWVLIQGRTSLQIVELKSLKQLIAFQSSKVNNEILASDNIKSSMVFILSEPLYIKNRKKYVKSNLCVYGMNGVKKCYHIPIEGKPKLKLIDTIPYLEIESDNSDFKYFKIKTPLYE